MLGMCPVATQPVGSRAVLSSKEFVKERRKQEGNEEENERRTTIKRNQKK
jgi:hypothetical protein